MQDQRGSRFRCSGPDLCRRWFGAVNRQRCHRKRRCTPPGRTSQVTSVFTAAILSGRRDCSERSLGLLSGVEASHRCRHSHILVPTFICDIHACMCIRKYKLCVKRLELPMHRLSVRRIHLAQNRAPSINSGFANPALYRALAQD